MLGGRFVWRREIWELVVYAWLRILRERIEVKKSSEWDIEI